MGSIDDVCFARNSPAKCIYEALISLCFWNHSYHLKIDCFVYFLIAKYIRLISASEYPLINHNPWMNMEDKNLLLLGTN